MLLIQSDQTDPFPSDAGPPTFLERWSTVILCFTLFLLPLIGMGAAKSLKVYASDVRQWLPRGFDEATTYDQFVAEFGIDEMVVISWPGATMTDPRVTAMREALEEQQLENGPMFSKVVCGPDMLAQVRSVGVDESTALSRIKGLVLGPDGKTTCVIGYPNASLKNSLGTLIVDRTEIIGRIREIAGKEFNISFDDLKTGGPTVDGAAIDFESKRSLQQFLWMSISVVFVLTWIRMRDLPLTLMVIGFSILASAISLAILHYGGGEMNLTMIMLPTLTFILGVSGCVHMVNYYRKASTMGHGIHSADQALKDGWYPIFLSSATTAVGMFSLCTSRVAPIRDFGVFAGIGVMAGTVIILFILPATLYLLKGRISKWFSSTGKMDKRQRATGLGRTTSLLINWVCREHGLVVVPTLIAVSVLSVGVFHLQASVKLQNRFANRAKILQDYEWLERNLGALVPMEVVLKFTPENKLSLWSKMKLVQEIERAIRRTTAVSATLSVATFEPYLPRGSRLGQRLEQRARLDKWKSEFKSFDEAKLVKIKGDFSSWRISLRIAALNDIDYGSFLESVEQNVNHQLRNFNQPGVTAVLTGGIPLIYKAQHQILSDLLISFLTAFFFISAIMMFVLKGIRSGLVAMLPNVFPPIIVFGAMGWMGRKIEIGSVMTASVALGIAVDDTIHFLTWYRRSTVDGNSRYKSIRFAFEHCAKAMIDSTLICGLGVAPFMLGIFMPTVNFAMLLVVMLFVALLGDLILLPALLAGPAGVLFRLKKKQIPNPNLVSPNSSQLENEIKVGN